MPSDEDENESDDASESVVESAEAAAMAGLSNVDLEVNIPAETIVSMYEAADTVRQARDSIRESIDWTSLYEAIESYFEEISRVIANDISGLDSPEDYDPDDLSVTPVAEQLGRESLDNLIEEIESGGYSDLEEYLDRLKTGREHFDNNSYGAAAFYFISVQDGLMSMLCDHFGYSTNDDGYYGRSKKVNAFAQAYSNQEFHGVETGDVIPPYEDFYEHRNAIVHGSPSSAYLDQDIAVLSMLFLMLTLNATVAELS
ncbi:hypothetical protein KY092_07230 [Natronomonas gomsonensis]|uniref:hypothetical protein n=1 Tax=Natronomonas gomsonensis TaxID=1046043 RepID=UPI0020CA48DF|nr:hypothetical protein [Natronomonas gomsonensis]MCY4730348.1 hypothetical protein [Natronomonas gomsonensis]